jgi:hypothetical protein
MEHGYQSIKCLVGTYMKDNDFTYVSAHGVRNPKVMIANMIKRAGRCRYRCCLEPRAEVMMKAARTIKKTFYG